MAVGEDRISKVSDLLAAFLDRNLSAKAERVSEFFRSWRRMAGDKLSAHSEVVEVDRGIVIVEADHPSWIQLLQMREEELLRRIRTDYPQLEIRGMAFRLKSAGQAARGAVPSEPATLDRLPDPEDRAGLQALALARARMEELREKEARAAVGEADGPDGRPRAEAENPSLGSGRAPADLGARAEEASGSSGDGKTALSALLSDFRRVVEERNAEGSGP